VDLGEVRGRSYFFLGHFSDVTNTLLIDTLLARGDTYVDIGAHFGWLSVHASRAAGPAGRVFAFEPSPDNFAVLEEHRSRNALDNLRSWSVALSDRRGEAGLTIGQDSATSTLRAPPRAERTVRVRVERLDALLAPTDFVGRVLVKIDAEATSIARSWGPDSCCRVQTWP